MLNEFRKSSASLDRQAGTTETPGYTSGAGKRTRGGAGAEAALQAQDVMSANVVTVSPDDTVPTLAQTLLEHGVRALPVIEGDKLVGCISDGDLVHRAEIGTARQPRSWWQTLFTSESKLAREYMKSHAHRVRDLMDPHVVAVAEDTPLFQVAATLDREGIESVPVVRSGKVIGVVSRADILQRFAAEGATPVASDPDDAQILDRINEEVRSHGWTNPLALHVTVSHGVVDIWGLYRTEEDRKAVRIAAEDVPGVKEVHDHRSQIRLPYVPYEA